VILPSYLELKTGSLLDAVLALWPEKVTGNLLATLITSVIYTVGMVGQYTGGHVGERYDPRWGYLLYHAVCIPCAFLMAVATEAPLSGLAMVYFFFLLGTQPCENTLVAGLTPRRLHHSAFGLKFVLTFGFGALAVKIAAWVASTWSVEAVFTALGVTAVLTAAFVGLLIIWTNRSGGFVTTDR
jgi:MFS family permease